MSQTYYIDGGLRGGPTSCVTDANGKVLHLKRHERGTNNEMEYAAFLAAAGMAGEGDTIVTDSRLVQGQVARNWRCNYAHLRPLRDFGVMLVKKKNLKVCWVPRDENKAGLVLEGKLPIGQK